jgi:hypothetical protein
MMILPATGIKISLIGAGDTTITLLFCQQHQ